MSDPVPVLAVRVTITAELVRRFAELTGDFSSLHMDENFARTSAYRANVAHGMLPIIFALCPSGVWKPGTLARIKKISGLFHKPVFIGDEVLVSLEASQEADMYEFTVCHTASQSTITSGTLKLAYASPPGPTGPAAHAQELPVSLLSAPLTEKDEVPVSKGTTDAFSFHLSSGLKPALRALLQSGLTDKSHGWSGFEACVDPSSLLAVCLNSTFVGMCIPGKRATFVDFQMEFPQPLGWDRTYQFSGVVSFYSASTSMLMENVQVIESHNGQVVAQGELKTKVNTPPAGILSIEELKARALDLRLKDKVVLVTGASRGIGATTAKLFSLFGAKVIVNYRQGQDDARGVVSDIVRNGGQAMDIKADVCDRSQVQHMIQQAALHFGPVDILVNNAVKDARSIPFLETTWDDIQKDVEVAVKGAFHCCQEVLPGMVARRGGKIINVSTIFAEYPPAGQTKYVVSKNALVGLTRTLAVEFAPHNIQVNLVVPAMAMTDLSSHVPKFMAEQIKNESPMKRHTQPEDVAQAIVFLASAFASFTTGQKFMVTGGRAPLL